VKKYFKIIIIILILLLTVVEYLWYKKESNVDILKKYPLYSIVGKAYPDKQIKTVNPIDGWLVYGPYTPMRKGEYEITYELFLNNIKPNENPSKVVGYVNIDVENHPTLIYQQNFTINDFKKTNPYKITLKFTIPEGLPKIQYRVFQYGGNEITLKGLKLSPKSFWSKYGILKSNFILYNFVLIIALFLILIPEYYWFRNKEVKKNRLLEGSVLVLILTLGFLNLNKSWLFKEDTNINVLKSYPSFTHVGTIDNVSKQVNGDGSKEGFLLFGQNVPLAKGKYRVKFKINLSNLNKNDDMEKKIAYCDVYIDGHESISGIKMLTNRDFIKRNPNTVSFKFRVIEDLANVQFRVYQYKLNILSVESIKLQSVIGKSIATVKTGIIRKLIVLILTIIMISCLIFIFKIYFNLLTSNRTKVVSEYVLVIILCLLTFLWITKLWKTSLRVPIDYGGDALFSAMTIKSTIDNNWYWNNKYSGAPTGLLMHDYPMSENVHFLIIKIISIFSSDWALVMNIFFILTFLLAAISALFVFRQFKISYAPAAAASLLYAFLPTHFFRNVSHLFVVSYYAVPLIIMVILWIYSDNPPFFIKEKNSENSKFSFRDYKSIVSLIIGLIISSTGIYYAFFACLFIIVAGFSSYLSHKKISNLVAALILLAVVNIGFIVNLSPSIVYKLKHGKNMATYHYDPNGAEIHGLKIIQMLLPISDHRIPAFAKLNKKYYAIALLVNENGAAVLGLVGSIGFIILIGWLFYRKSSCSNEDLTGNLSELNVAAVLFATIGGFSSLFAFLISPQLRAYNRISVFISFFSLFAVVLLLDKIYHKFIKTELTKFIYYVLIMFIFVFGILDETNKTFVFPATWVQSEYNETAGYIKKIESSVPKNSMIFQLPYLAFPESPTMYWMGAYELFKGYLHSHTLRWSFGSMKGRECDLWQKEVTAKPLNEFLEEISLVGFNGIYVDKYGFADAFAPAGPDIVSKLSDTLKIKPVTNYNNRFFFFNLEEYNKKLQKKYSAVEIKTKRDAIFSKYKLNI